MHIYILCIYIYIYWEVKDKSERYTFGNQIVRRMTKGKFRRPAKPSNYCIVCGFSSIPCLITGG